MDIAIIGTGNVGRALATSLTRAGHHVILTGRDAAKTREVASQIGASSSASARDAVAASDAVIIAVPFSAAAAVADEIASVAQGKVVIDATNPLKPDLSGLATEPGTSVAEDLASRLPGAEVVKAFNTLFASVQADPRKHGVTLDGLYATDDADGRAAITGVLESIGLRPVNVGGLANARELEAMAFLNIKVQVQNGGAWDSAYTLVGAPAAATAPDKLAA